MLNGMLVFPVCLMALIGMHQQAPVFDRVIESLIDAHDVIEHRRTDPATFFQIGHVVTQLRGGLGGLQQLHALLQLSLHGLAFADVADDGAVVFLAFELDVMDADLDRNQPPVPGTVLPFQKHVAVGFQLGEMFLPVVSVTVAIQVDHRQAQQFLLVIAQHAAGGLVAIEEAAVRPYPVDRLAGALQGELTQTQRMLGLLALGDVMQKPMPDDAAVRFGRGRRHGLDPDQTALRMQDAEFGVPDAHGPGRCLDACQGFVPIVRMNPIDHEQRILGGLGRRHPVQVLHMLADIGAMAGSVRPQAVAKHHAGNHFGDSPQLLAKFGLDLPSDLDGLVFADIPRDLGGAHDPAPRIADRRHR